jgi:hypothetical protein
VLPRRLIAWLAAASILPQAAADECLWPQPEDAPAAFLPAAGGVEIRGPASRVRVEVHSWRCDINSALDCGINWSRIDRERNQPVAT